MPVEVRMSEAEEGGGEGFVEAGRDYERVGMGVMKKGRPRKAALLLA